MQANTLTEVKNLRPGDTFTRYGNAMKFKVVPGKPVMIKKKLYQISAVVIGNNNPILFRGSEMVIYLKSKS